MTPIIVNIAIRTRLEVEPCTGAEADAEQTLRLHGNLEGRAGSRNSGPKRDGWRAITVTEASKRTEVIDDQQSKNSERM